MPDHHRGPRQRLPARHRADHDVPLPRRRRASASTAGRRTPAPRSRRTSTRCWPSSPAAAATFEKAVERARRAVAEFRIRGVSTNIPFLQAVLDDPDFRAGRVTTSFIETHPQLLTARGAGDRGTKLLTYLADVTVNQPHGAARRSTSTRRPSCPTSTCGCPPRRDPPAAAASSGRRGSRRRLRAQDAGRGHRHHLPRRPPVAARDPGPHPRPGRRRRPRRPDDAAAVVARDLGRGDVRRGAALPRRGPVGAAGRDAAGGAQPVPADAAARPQHRRLHAVPDRGDAGVRRGGRRDRDRRVPDLRRAQRRRADAAGHRGGACDRVAPSPRWRSATPATCPTRARSSTPSTTTCGWPSGSSTPAPTCWRSRTWPGCCGHRRPAPWSPRCATRFDLPVHLHTHDTPGGQLATLVAAIESGVDAVDARQRAHGRHDLAAVAVRPGRRDRPLRPRDRAVAGGAVRRSSRTGRRCAGSTRRSSPGCRRRPAASTPTRSPAASSPTCASRRSRSGSARSSSRSRTCTPPPTTSSATSSR